MVSNLVPGGIDRIVHKANTTEDIVRIEVQIHTCITLSLLLYCLVCVVSLLSQCN